jgi:hypothetical protein
MTWRQNNKQWSGGIAAHSPAPKNSECKNPLKNFLPRFFGIKTTSSSLITLKSQTISAEYYSALLVQLNDILKENHGGKFPKGVLFLHNALAHRALCNPEETHLPGLPVS